MGRVVRFTQGGGLNGLALGWYDLALSARQMEPSDGGYGVDIGSGGVGGLVDGGVVDGDDASATPQGSRGAIGEGDPEVFAVLRRSGYLLPTRWVGKARCYELVF
jgi:hypothetical protein